VSGGTTLTIQGSGFQSATAVSFNGKTAAITFKDINTLSVVAPGLTPGPQQIIIAIPMARLFLWMPRSPRIRWFFSRLTSNLS
jgi:hypothetical protein